jgi:hypothetical protein
MKTAGVARANDALLLELHREVQESGVEMSHKRSSLRNPRIFVLSQSVPDAGTTFVLGKRANQYKEDEKKI